MDKYRAEEPQYLWYCGTKKYRKDNGTGTVENGATNHCYVT